MVGPEDKPMTTPSHDPELHGLKVLGRADDLLARLDTVTPSDGDQMCAVYQERGWIEAVRHFAEKGMLTPAGVAEAGALVAASHEWADTLPREELVSPPLPPVPLGDAPAGK
jgi:hypothetical protein